MEDFFVRNTPKRTLSVKEEQWVLEIEQVIFFEEHAWSVMSKWKEQLKEWLAEKAGVVRQSPAQLLPVLTHNALKAKKT